MTLHQFTLFAAVAKHLNVRRASQEVRVSQPAITHQLKQLEDGYGAKLYRRSSNGVEITEAGQVLLREIKPILDQVANLEKELRPATIRAAREILKVGGSLSASAELLPALLARFRQSRPQVELELRTRTSEELERLVATSELDLAVTVRQPVTVELACEPLLREKIAMFVPADHRLAKKDALTAGELLAEPLVIRGGKGSSGVADVAMQQIRNQGGVFKIAMLCDGPTAIKAAVRQGMGVGMVYEDSLKPEVASGEFKILKVKDLELAGQSFIIYSDEQPLSHVAHEFLDLLRAARTPNGRAGGSNRSSRSTAALRSNRAEPEPLAVPLAE